jgi:hypothetical protein
MRAIIAFAVIAALCAPTHSEEGSAATGLGTQTCAVFAQHYKNDPKLADLAYGSWAQGFMAGLNFATGTDKPRNIAALTTAQHSSVFRSACDRRPLAKFIEIVLIHYFSLPELP